MLSDVGTDKFFPAKHAVVGMTKQMALDYAKDRIHINCLCPGFVDTPMISFFTAKPEVNEQLSGMHPWVRIVGYNTLLSETCADCTQ